MEIFIQETELAELAKKFRTESGRTKADVARELDIAKTTMQHAEESPERSLTAVRIRIIEMCSDYHVVGPVFLLKKKQSAKAR